MLYLQNKWYLLYGSDCYKLQIWDLHLLQFSASHLDIENSEWLIMFIKQFTK